MQETASEENIIFHPYSLFFHHLPNSLWETERWNTNRQGSE